VSRVQEPFWLELTLEQDPLPQVGVVTLRERVPVSSHVLL
tara:strand:+ start:1452 stop:1571 length:120 start_codon:yes stop_codon:yes gene_type:complete